MATRPTPTDRGRQLETLYLESLHAREAGVKWIAFAIALVLHCVVLLINFPEFKQAVGPKAPKNYIVVRKYVPPPPKVEQPRRQAREFTRKIPIPDPTPDQPEPIREPEPEIQPEPYPEDAVFLIGTPEPPGPPGPGIGAEPLIAGVGGVTQPVRIAESYVRPEYPELARVARIEGRVILQAVVLTDGSIGEVTVLSCNRPAFGFEEMAVEAVKQWHYKPALQDGHPVDVYFTILVDFELV